MKTQTIRLVDVFLLGPFMIWAGTELRSPLTRNIMIAAGVATIFYNGNNYLRVERGEQPQANYPLEAINHEP